jgi:hypothetical protein
MGWEKLLRELNFSKTDVCILPYRWMIYEVANSIWILKCRIDLLFVVSWRDLHRNIAKLKNFSAWEVQMLGNSLILA